MRRMGLLLLAGACALATLAGGLGVSKTGEGTGRGGSLLVAAAAQREGSRPSYERSFNVQVTVNGYPLEQYPARGRLYVEAREGAEYGITIRNPLPDRVAVALAVDGLNTIDARHTTARAASKWVIEPYGSITISGWQMSSTRARRFYFTSERDSYAARMGRPDDLGLITAVFFRERRPVAVVPPPRPPYILEDETTRVESKDKRDAPAERQQSRAESAGQARNRSAVPYDNDEYAATGIGRAVDHDVRWVNLDLEERPMTEVSIRYEYRPTLVRLGILPRPYPQTPEPLQRRERARGFRDGQFCPEP